MFGYLPRTQNKCQKMKGINPQNRSPILYPQTGTVPSTEKCGNLTAWKRVSCSIYKVAKAKTKYTFNLRH